MLVTMKAILDRASVENYGVAAPNITSELDARAYIEAAEELNAPVILDIYYPVHPNIRELCEICRQLAIRSSVPVAINLDHGGKREEIIEAISGGFTSVMVDRSSESFEDNVKEVKEIVDIAHAAGISVEAELGHVGQADNYENDRDAALTSPEQAKKYVELTGVDCLAVAIGTAHGSYPKGFVPTIDFDRLAEIKEIVGTLPLVLHGSSGTSLDDLRKVCKMGINKINVGNDLFQTAVHSVTEGDLEGGKANDVYYVIREAVKAKLKELICVYGSDGKAWVPEDLGITREFNYANE